MVPRRSCRIGSWLFMAKEDRLVNSSRSIPRHRPPRTPNCLASTHYKIMNSVAGFSVVPVSRVVRRPRNDCNKRRWGIDKKIPGSDNHDTPQSCLAPPFADQHSAGTLLRQAASPTPIGRNCPSVVLTTSRVRGSDALYCAVLTSYCMDCFHTRLLDQSITGTDAITFFQLLDRLGESPWYSECSGWVGQLPL